MSADLFTQPERDAKRQRQATLINVLVIVTIASLVTATAIIVALFATAARQSDQLAELRRNHEASVCLISVIHAISASSGKGQEETQRNFQRIFSEQWLTEHCALTPEEARRVVSDS